MSKPQVDHEVINKQDEEETDYLGTFVSVLLLGGFLIVTWVGVWILFLIR